MRDGNALVGIDVGGTFTDAVVIIDGRTYRAKSASTYPEIGKGVLASCRLAAQAAGETLETLLPRVRRFGLSTTAVTNVIATRRGLRVGLLITKGFEETVRAARGQTETIDGWLSEPVPLVQRNCVVGISERIDRNGQVIKPLDTDQVIAAGRRLVYEQGVESLTVSFLWAFANPVHEAKAVDLLRREFPNVVVTSGIELRPAIREFERTTLALLNAYSIGAYAGIEALAESLALSGLTAPVLLCHSDGGSISIGEAASKPVWLAGSGPAAGVSAAARVSSHAATGKALTCDLGGTSFDVSHIEVGEPARIRRGKLMGIWTALPRVDVESAGAGGGSIAWLDQRNLLRVGPQSAGSYPGPACYDRGGSMATLTDALLVLGYIDADRFLGGTMRLHRLKAEAACARLGEGLGFDAVETAWGIREIALAEMTKAARARLAIHALSVHDRPLISYGGCASLFAADVAGAIGAPSVLISEFASVLSAFGAATMDIRRERMVSFVRRLPMPPDDLGDTFERLRRDVLAELAADGVADGDCSILFEADVCFEGQRWELSVGLPERPKMEDGGEEIEGIFRREYLRRFGPSAAVKSGPVQLVAVRAIGIGSFFAGQGTIETDASDTRPAECNSKRPIQVDRSGPARMIDQYDGVTLSPGDWLVGPAVIDNADTTIWIPGKMKANMDSARTLVVEACL